MSPGTFHLGRDNQALCGSRRERASAALCLCAGAAFVLDDAAGTTAAAPRSLARRRMLRIGLALPLLAGVWIGSLWYVTAAMAMCSGSRRAN